MTRLISSKLIFPELAAVLLIPIWLSHMSAQSTSKAATIISDAQAETLMQILASQQNGGTTTLTPAQSQMLMQYLLSKNGSSATSTALGTVQTQMLLQNAAAQGLATQGRGVSAGKALTGPTPVTMPAATTSPAAAPASAQGDKKNRRGANRHYHAESSDRTKRARTVRR